MLVLPCARGRTNQGDGVTAVLKGAILNEGTS